ncbi:inner membrane protein YbjM [Duffyella gerundensis]|uniref:inner membrane protein YbjM n=1 Tax=Duffyella gerundensis TaxID=1619313 RepID=UPI0021F7ACAB|nr:inner membrane protein YbjM [Duffyella gerundensis]
MPLRAVRLSAVINCLSLYCAIFILARYSAALGQHGQPALLLFMLPGALAGLIARPSAVTVALSGALLATPVCLLMLALPLLNLSSPLQEFAWHASAIFLCVCGALLVSLWRALFPRRQLH